MAKEVSMLYWEDFVAGQIDEFGDKVVTREEIVDFARQFDPQPFHLDEDAARKSLLGGLCASGWHTCALAMRMIYDQYLHRAVCHGSPGIENLRWLKPVFVDDRLHMRFEVLETRTMSKRPTIGMVFNRWELLNQDNELVMQMEGNILFGRRPADV